MPILLTWFALPLVVFVLSRSRLPAYLLPLFPALTLILALETPRRWAQTPGKWFGIRPWPLVAYASLLAALSLASIPMAERSSWKREAIDLQGRLVADYELITLSAGDAASLEFYLASPRIEHLRAKAGVPPALETVQQEAAEWRETDEGRMPHFVFAQKGDSTELGSLLDGSSILIGTKARRSLWLATPSR